MKWNGGPDLGHGPRVWHPRSKFSGWWSHSSPTLQNQVWKEEETPRSDLGDRFSVTIACVFSSWHCVSTHLHVKSITAQFELKLYFFGSGFNERVFLCKTQPVQGSSHVKKVCDIIVWHHRMTSRSDAAPWWSCVRRPAVQQSGHCLRLQTDGSGRKAFYHQIHKIHVKSQIKLLKLELRFFSQKISAFALFLIEAYWEKKVFFFGIFSSLFSCKITVLKK